MRMYTILLADDDPALLELVATVLTDKGFTVLTARDGYEAIRILSDRHIDMMIADLMMGGLTGKELAAQARVMRPKLRIIYMTGYGFSEEIARHGRVVAKPIRAAELIRIIKEEMSAG